MIQLQNLHLKYDTDKGTAHSYIDTYDKLFAKFQKQPINFLEIGALTCGSLKMFHEYFTQAIIWGVDDWSQKTNHYGQDLNQLNIDQSKIIEDVTDNYTRIKLVTCNSLNKQQVAKEFQNTQFQIIIDDGDHNHFSQLTTFSNFYPFWDSNGVYIIEDVNEPNLLIQGLEYYKTINSLSYQWKVYEFYKDGRGDDILIQIGLDV